MLLATPAFFGVATALAGQLMVLEAPSVHTPGAAEVR